MPGSFCRCSMRRASGSGRETVKSQTPKRTTQSACWDLEFGHWDFARATGSQARNLQAAHEPAHRSAELLIDLAAGVVDGGDDHVLQHLDIVFRDDLRIDRDRLQLLPAVDDDLHHAAAGGRL